METQTILPTFLGSTQVAPMGASCVLPSVASLTGRSVCNEWEIETPVLIIGLPSVHTYGHRKIWFFT